MVDHHYATLTDNLKLPIKYVEIVDLPEIDSIEEKEGDNILIELYKERKFLYDNSHRDFKNKQKKEHAWLEISTIMQQRKMGKFYTPEYCQTRCTSLRDQYSRERRNMKDDKSGNASKRKTFLLRGQLSFLDNFIKRRRTFSYIQRTKSALQPIKDVEAITLEKNSNNESTDDSEYIQQSVIKRPQKRNSACQDASQDTENNKDHKCIEINVSRFKRHKIDESVCIEDTSTNVNNANMKSLGNAEKSSTNNTSMIDQSFANYIRVHLENIPEPEKSTRKKMIIDALTEPLPKTCSFLKHCTCEMLMKQLFHHLAAIHQ